MPDNSQQSCSKSFVPPCLIIFITLVICFAVLIVLFATGVFKASKYISEETKRISAEMEKAEEKAWKDVYSIDQEVTFDKTSWKVLEVKDLGKSLDAYSSYMEDCESISGKFIQVKFAIKNLTNEPSTFSSINGIYLYDENHTQYIRSMDLNNCFKDNLSFYDTVNPGIEQTYTVIFEVPKEASGLRLQVCDNKIIDKEFAYIDLGL